MLSADEIERYKRHLAMKDIGGPGQQKLKAARVLVVGAGGLGAPLLLYLAAAGVGHIGLIDDDTVALANLQRQICYETDDAGALKAERAAARVQKLNPHVRVSVMPYRLTGENALEILANYDIVADGSDNFKTRYLVNDACYFAKKPLVYAALGALDGYLTTFRAFERDASGAPFPNYRCLFPQAPETGTVANCEEAGVLGPVAGVMGTLQAVEVIKELLGLGQSLAGKLLIYDALAARFQTIAVPWDPENPLTGRSPILHDLSSHGAASP